MNLSITLDNGKQRRRQALKVRGVCDQRAEGRPDRASWPRNPSGDESRFAIGI